MKVVFLFLPALRFAISATDKLLSFIKNLELPGALEDCSSLFDVPFCLLEVSLRLFSLVSLLLSLIGTLPRFLDKDVYQEEQCHVSLIKMLHNKSYEVMAFSP
jgi:hypothetical protein